MAKDRWKCAISLLTGMRKTLEYGQAHSKKTWRPKVSL
jgi:hypothetical protein